MIVICIKNLLSSTLTVGKYYETLPSPSTIDECYYIENDDNNSFYISKSAFITLEEHRNSQIDLILDK